MSERGPLELCEDRELSSDTWGQVTLRACSPPLEAGWGQWEGTEEACRGGRLWDQRGRAESGREVVSSFQHVEAEKVKESLPCLPAARDPRGAISGGRATHSFSKHMLELS